MAFGAPVKHLLMDLDGTLLGNRPLPLGLDFARRALAKTMQATGTGWARAASTLLEVNGALRRKSMERANDVRVVELFARRMGITVDESRVKLREGLFEIFPELERHFFPIEGATEFLEWARTRYQLTLATNPVWPQAIVELRVRWAGIDPAIFGFVSHVKTMNACKPEPEYYDGVLKHLGAKADECLLVGNDMKMDLPAARRGIRVFIVDRRREELLTLGLKGAKAKAWTGTYAHLRGLLGE